MVKVGISWQIGSGFGWGVLGINFALELIRTWNARPVLFEASGDLNLKAKDRSDIKKCLNGYGFLEKQRKNNPENPPVVDFPVFYCGGNQFQHNIQVLSSKDRRSIVFFENTHFDKKMTEAGKLFTRIYAGSKWNAEILRSRGFERVIPWAQGIDLEMFSPHGTILPRSDKFRIYSGGKLEFRKGQDITLEAFKKFHQKYPDSELIVAWDSPWPIIAMSMARSKYVKAPALDLNQKYNLEKWMFSEGMPENSFQNIGSLPNYKMPELMRSCDVGLFPNRAEGGTNLVAMESIACGLPCILSNNTGHKDLLEEVDCYSLEEQKKVSPLNEKDGTEGWGESSIEEIFSQLEFAYNNRDLNKQKGLNAAKKIQRWSWFNKVGELVNDL